VREPVETLDAHPDELQIWAVRMPAPGPDRRLLLRLDGATWEADALGSRDGLAIDHADPGPPAIDVYHLAVRQPDEAAIVTWLTNHVGAGIPTLARDLARELERSASPPCIHLVLLAYAHAGVDIADWAGRPPAALRPHHVALLARRHPDRCVYRGVLALEAINVQR